MDFAELNGRGAQWRGPVYLMRSALLASVLVFGALAHGQAHRDMEVNSNLWISHWGDHRVSDHWGIHTEAHWRRADMGLHWQQMLVRPAVNYHLSDQVMFTLGYSYYRNYPYGTFPTAFPSWEHQAYQQVQLNQPIGRLRISHRFRMEERFIAQLNASENDPFAGELDRYGYQNRFRYRAWFTVPLSKRDRTGAGVFTANLYDELFLNFGDPQRLDLMNQNRISALLGYQATASMQVIAGYLHQNLQRPGAAAGADLMEVNSTLHMVVVWNLDLRKKMVQAQP
ncbi:MAG: DUF2490 domain-containing protein [Flavobacteriales bacterium]|nr:DUF2490 domain-containing protein [Flavobacteriales bacterium]MBK7620616.1 DUF2490 domain-containing protein [Flavobacteriales bacterium]